MNLIYRHPGCGGEVSQEDLIVRRYSLYMKVQNSNMNRFVFDKLSLMLSLNIKNDRGGRGEGFFKIMV